MRFDNSYYCVICDSITCQHADYYNGFSRINPTNMNEYIEAEKLRLGKIEPFPTRAIGFNQLLREKSAQLLVDKLIKESNIKLHQHQLLLLL